MDEEEKRGDGLKERPLKEEDADAQTRESLGSVEGMAGETERPGTSIEGESAGGEIAELTLGGESSQMLPELRESAHKIWLAGLGTMAAAEQEGTRFFKRMVERGEELEERGRERLRDVREKTEDRIDQVRSKTGERLGEVSQRLGESFDEKVTRVVRRSGAPSREEFLELLDRVERVERQLEKLAQGDGGDDD